MWYYNYIHTESLYHHGILGQKWGVRRFQNKDGSLTPAGIKRYSVNIEAAKTELNKAKTAQKAAVKKFNQQTAYGMIYNPAANNALKSANTRIRRAKADLKDEQIKEKLNSQSNKSKRRLNLEEYYKSKGMTDEEAAIAAYKRERTEKIIAVTAGLTVAAAAAYAGYKYHDYSVDKILPPGTTLQNISGFKNRGVKDAFYASFNDRDNTFYRGMYGYENVKRYGKSFESKFDIANSLNLASDRNAKKVFSDLIARDPKYVETLKRSFKDHESEFPESMKKAIKSLDNGKIDNNVYKMANTILPGRTHGDMELKNKFYDALKSKGYDAIYDINDQRKTFFHTPHGYGTKSPIIVFNGSAKIGKATCRELLKSEIRDNYKKAVSYYAKDEAIAELSRSLSILGGISLASVGITKGITTKKNDSIVKEYREKHPDTNLSYKEIVRNYYDNHS